MKCQILFSRKNKKIITSVSSAELDLKVIKVENKIQIADFFLNPYL